MLAAVNLKRVIEVENGGAVVHINQIGDARRWYLSCPRRSNVRERSSGVAEPATPCVRTDGAKSSTENLLTEQVVVQVNHLRNGHTVGEVARHYLTG